MKMTKTEYDEMIRKRPSLAPTFTQMTTSSYVTKSFEVKIPCQVTHNQERSFIRPPAVKFTIPGDPVGKPRMTQQDKWRKRPVVMKYWKWAALARASVPKSVDLGLYRQISFVAWIGFPKSYSKKRRALLTNQPHFEKPDGDNILKSLLDSLFKEDKRIWKFLGEKRWDDGNSARIEVELR